VTNHYGYIRDDFFWDSKYFKFFNDALRAPGVIALSDIVVEKMKQH